MKLNCPWDKLGGESIKYINKVCLVSPIGLFKREHGRGGGG